MAKTTGKAVVSWQDEVAKDAKAVAAQEASVQLGSFISLRGGRFSFNGNQLKDDHMDVVVLDHVAENAYYEGRFDPDAPASPVCFAFGTDEKTMAPHPDAPKPQHPTCQGCPQNQFGSADTGKGKACKNQRKLALIHADQLGDVANAEVAFMRLPPTSVKPWAAYVQTLAATTNRPPYAMVTTVSIGPDPKTQFKLSFRPEQPLDMDRLFTALKAKRAEVAPALVVPYAPVEASEKPAASPRKRKY